jgi:farnesyl-diphosphate farnesyltransferase
MGNKPVMQGRVLEREKLDDLLGRTSRTFALAIPLLEAVPQLARSVGLAYLVFRIADTLEDAPLWGRDRRGVALAAFSESLEARAARALYEDEAPPTRDEACLELLARTEDVLASVEAAGPKAAEVILAAGIRTARGMAEFVARQDERGGLVLGDLADLRRYAYVVAGIVGELLTELFVLHDERLARVAVRLAADAPAFGEGLQLVNILKDAPADRDEGREYLPRDLPRASVFELARADLASAARYVDTLTEAHAAPGIVAFCELPRRLAVATLDLLEAGGSKLARDEVLRLYRAVTDGMASASSSSEHVDLHPSRV